MLIHDLIHTEFLDNLYEGIWIIDSNANITFVNTFLLGMFGYKRNEMTGKHITCFIDEKDKNNLLGIIRQTKTSKMRALCFIDKHGGKLYTKVHSYPLIDANEKNYGTLAVVRNIADKTLLADEYKTLEHKFKSIFNNISLGIAILDHKGKICTANQRLCEKIGCSIDELINKSVFDFFSVKDNAKISNLINEILNGSNKSLSSEYKYQKSNGSFGWAQIGFFSVGGSLQAERTEILFSLRDISEKKHFEETLSKNEALFRGVLENSNSIITIWDKDLKNIYHNRKALEIVGKKYENIPKGMHLDELSVDFPEFYEKWEKRISESFENGIAYTYSDSDFLANTLVLSENSLTPIKDPQGNVFAIAIIFRDVTERKMTDKRLAEREKLASIGEMVAYLAHEIKSPLACTLMNLELIQEGRNLTDRQKESLTLINSEISRLNNLLKEILELSSAYTLNYSYFDIITVIDSVYELFKVNLRGKNIQFVSEVNSQKIYGDVNLIKTVIINLIENSMEAIDRDGNIKLYAAFKADNDFIDLYIKDSGCGITETEKIFTPFYTNKHNGTGLGLPNAKNIIEKHGGFIQLVTTEPGKTIFQIRLPINAKNC